MATNSSMVFNSKPFRWTDNLHNGLSLRFARMLIEKETWATLKPASKAIYPCLLKFVNKGSGLAFPCLHTLAIVSGVSEKTAGEGIKGLDGLPGFMKETYITRRGHTAYKYKIQEPPPDRDHTIWISHHFINGGNWSLLTPTAKAVFPVLKHFSWWDGRYYCELENLDSSMDDLDLQCLYPDRKYDFIDAEDEIVCKFSGITKRSLQNAYESLHKHHFVSPLRVAGRRVWKTYIYPPKHYKREWLNQRIENRYGNTF
jgi:hypothetical protein